jgi:hypothetical protein
MQKAQCLAFRISPQKALAAALAATLGCPSSGAYAGLAAGATWPVANCADSGSGSLRDAVQNLAASGDTVDLRQTPCSVISLTTGAIIITQNALTLVGPGRDALAIDGAGDLPGYGVLFHNGAGTLEVDGLTLKNGSKYTNATNKYALGGCIHSSGNVTLNYSTVSTCKATGGGNDGAFGGGIYARGNLVLGHSMVTGNTARALGNNTASAGGVYIGGYLNSSYSTISQNAAPGTSQYKSYGGGVVVAGDVTFTNSTISGNSAYVAGGIFAGGNLTLGGTTVSGNRATITAGLAAAGATHTALIVNSTISGNIASGANSRIGAMDLSGPATIANSTIAFNQASIDGGLYAAGTTLNLESSIIADNSASGAPSDLNALQTTSISGANNLITSSTATFDSGTITACPRLGPLADNGGSTLTHALAHTSPAIDKGSNSLALATDQRGLGFPRMFGTAADIGAFEWQHGIDDRIFSSRFELGCSN